MGKIAYITVKAPYGRLGETYIFPEMLAIIEKGMELLILPRDRSEELFHRSAEPLVGNTLSVPLFSSAIAKDLLKVAFRSPLQLLALLRDTVFRSRNAEIALKNIRIVPKAVHLSERLKSENIDHIHAHYGSTTSTMAYIISVLTGIPWSFTVHRWDIPENNLLSLKCRNAVFVRAIDERGREEVIRIVNGAAPSEKIRNIHVGIHVNGTSRSSDAETGKPFTILCPAMLVLKKGHKYLFEACRLLSERGRKFRCLIAGDGPLRDELGLMAENSGLNGTVELLGALTQEQMFGLYKSGSIDLVVLPSIVTGDGEKEGIPVSLMEAMSYAIPVISTDTGGIPELLGCGSGIIVNEKDPVSLSSAIEKLMEDEAYCRLLGARGREKVEQEFNVSDIADRLLNLFSPNHNSQANNFK